MLELEPYVWQCEAATCLMPTRDMRGHEHKPDDHHMHEPCALQEAIDTFCGTCGYYEGESDDVAHDNLCCGSGRADWCSDNDADYPTDCYGHHLSKRRAEAWRELAPGQRVDIAVPVHTHGTVRVERYDAVVEVVVRTVDRRFSSEPCVKAQLNTGKEVRLETLYEWPDHPLMPYIRAVLPTDAAFVDMLTGGQA